MTNLVPGSTTTPCVDCGNPIKIYPPEDGYDTRWRCGRCGKTAVATVAERTSPVTNTKIHHSMLCSRSGAVVETLTPEPTGQCRVVDKCEECGGTDLVDRMRREEKITNG